MVNQNTLPQINPSFQSSVELVLSPGSADLKKWKPGHDIVLIARFRDFLGEPTRDTGMVVISATKGTLSIPNGGQTGSEIILEQGLVPVGDTGEMPIVLKPGNEHGLIEISICCTLGETRTEITLPAPSGFAVAEMMESIIYAFLVAMVIRIFFFQTFWIPSGSMEPTLYEGDRIIANKLIYRMRMPHHGEVVIFRVFQPSRRGLPGRLTLDEAREVSEPGGQYSLIGKLLANPETSSTGQIEVQDYIKRIIGLPGDVVEIENGEIYVNGEMLIENFSTRPPDYNHFGPVTVPPGEIFVLGDNRSNSQDSHVIGTIPIRNIEGRAEAVFWPPKRISLIPQGR